jgi:hypothetical protein
MLWPPVWRTSPLISRPIVRSESSLLLDAEEEPKRIDLGIRSYRCSHSWPATDLDSTGVATDAKRQGVEVATFGRQLGSPLATELVGKGVVDLTTGLFAYLPCIPARRQGAHAGHMTQSSRAPGSIRKAGRARPYSYLRMATTECQCSIP